MEETALKRMLHAYGITDYQLMPPQKGYRNLSYGVVTSDQTLNLMIYKREPGIAERIQRANRIGDFLAQHGLPARQTADRRILKVRSANSERYVSLYEYLPGQTIPWEAYTMEHLKQLGQVMAKMHHEFATIPDRHSKKGPSKDHNYGLFSQYQQGVIRLLPGVEQECLETQTQMQDYFKQQGVLDALRAKLGLTVLEFDFSRLLKRLLISGQRQALHMDFVRGNVLFSGKEISGILDFEKAATGHPGFDIGRTLAFLLIDCKYKTEQQIRKYFLQSGYTKHGIGHIDMPPATLNSLVQFFLLHDFYKFLRHNPYESLHLNEHFVRTKNLLLKSGLLSEL